jgi:tRNA A37 threonylcarbamoyladenosine dehydratase
MHCTAPKPFALTPLQVRVGDLAESVADPLCRAVRYGLRKHHGITTGVPVLLSTEKQRCVRPTHPPLSRPGPHKVLTPLIPL